MPESERTFARVVIGLPPHGAFRKSAARGIQDPRAVELRRRLFGLDFELLHGASLSAAPAYSVFYVAVPDPATVPEASGEEEADFRSYLASRLGWPEAVIGPGCGSSASPVPSRTRRTWPRSSASTRRAGSSSASARTRTRSTSGPPKRSSGVPAGLRARRLAGLHVGDVNTEGGDLAAGSRRDGRPPGRHRTIRYPSVAPVSLGRPLTVPRSTSRARRSRRRSSALSRDRRERACATRREAAGAVSLRHGRRRPA